MKSLFNNLGIIFVLIGVMCLVVYFFGVQSNILLATSLVLEITGISAHIFINKMC